MEIKAEEIVTAYKQLDIKPRQTIFYQVINGEQCGCAITAYAMTKGFIPDASNNAMIFLEELGFDKSYLWALIYGFDESTAYHDHNSAYQEGKRAWELLELEGLT